MISVVFRDQHRAHPLGIIAVVSLHITRILRSCHVFNFLCFVHCNISSLRLLIDIQIDIQMVTTILSFPACHTGTLYIFLF